MFSRGIPHEKTYFPEIIPPSKAFFLEKNLIPNYVVSF
jgi:hypothetical protein